MTLPKLILLDRDATLNYSSSSPDSPIYYITELDHLIIKPGVKEALQLIHLHRVPTVLVTKQRCIDKGIASRERVDLINARIQRLLSHDFDEIRIEAQAETKKALYDNVLNQYSWLRPQEIHLFDDSEDERTIAARMGFTAHDGTNLLEAVMKVFSIR